MKNRHASAVLVAFLLLPLAAQGQEASAGKASQRAIAVLEASKTSNVRGLVRFSPQTEGMRVYAEISGLEPGKHAVHIHEFGDCSADDFQSAGEHYNPLNHPHAGPDNEQRHVGDLGNLEADQHGNVKHQALDRHLKLSGEHSVLGRSVVIHEKADDLKTQPA